ncbi:hypothetical protein QBC47DRAFT_461517 [Echria macrotheca]|uniref:Tetraspanin n=1 Tax=Echria macrotheca TaxID=438768 RepID=A0AAJ0B9Y9_9PEZI|nr:hypothetical protein QBC47DRAFT_461517 [Echria macrotheca]
MSLWIPLYTVLFVGLMIIAICQLVTATRLSLPIPTAVLSLTIALPILGAILTAALPSICRSIAKSPTRNLLGQLTPLLLQSAQLVFTTVLATLLASDAIPSPVRDCLLETKWKKFWTEHDSEAIRAIQDALGCCGFRSVKDMAWPFPRGQPGAPGSGPATCAARYGRTLACRVPWREAMASTAWWDFGVAIGVAVLQIVGWILINKFGDRVRESTLWKVVERFVGRRDETAADDEERVRPLLGPVEDEPNGEGRAVSGYSLE